MSVCVAVTDNPEGRAALDAAVREATRLGAGLVAVNLSGAELDPATLGSAVDIEVVPPQEPTRLDEVEVVLSEIEARPEVTLLVVGVRHRSAIGKAVLGSIAQRLIIDATVPVLSVKTTDR